MSFEIDRDLVMYLTKGDTGLIKVAPTVDGKPWEMGAKDTLTLTVSRSVDLTDPLIQKTATGTPYITIEPEDTAGMQPGRYVYEVKLRTADGRVETVTGFIPPAFRLGRSLA